MILIVFIIMALALIPTAFLYATFVMLLREYLGLLKVPFSTLVAILCLLGITFGASHLLNKPIIQEVDKYKNLDVALVGKLRTIDTIAIFSGRYGDVCNKMCQLLLYNNAVRKVIIITDVSSINEDKEQKLASYEIERRDDCIDDEVLDKKGHNIAINNIKNHMALGKCLVKKTSTLHEADAVFFHRKISQNKGYQNFMSLRRRIIFVNYIELLEKVDDVFKKSYRYSKISAQPFSYPLRVGSIFAGAGGRLNFGFYHSKLSVNGSHSSYGDPLQDFKLQMEELFGDALNPLKVEVSQNNKV